MNIVKKILFVILSRAYRIYSSRIRNYNFEELKLKILPGVFHPGFFFSTKFLISYLSKFDLNNKSLLELGAGSGMISVYCARRGAIVTASDISSSAIENIKLNSSLNNCNVSIVHSDLFDSIPNHEFDFIIINPPYFPKDPKNESECAWYCGSKFQYFEKLFKQLIEFIKHSTTVLMVLSEDCDIKSISSIAGKNNIEMKLKESKKFFTEMNFIFQLHLIKN